NRFLYRRIETIGESRPIQDLPCRFGHLREHPADFASFLADAVNATPVSNPAEARQRRHGAVDDAQDFAKGDLFRLLQKQVAARLAAPAHDDALVLEIEQDLLEELLGDALTFGYFGNHLDAVRLAPGKHDQRLQGVFGLL